LRVFPALLACALTLVAMALPVAARAADPEQEAVDQVNQLRAERGLAALQVSSSLRRSASRYAAEMIRRHYFGHLAHIEIASRFRHAGEALAIHWSLSPQPLKTVRQWMASPPHRALLMSSRFRFVGLGLAHGRFGSRPATTWVAHLGAL
jgi:uncharacterized protein YkwD